MDTLPQLVEFVQVTRRTPNGGSICHRPRVWGLDYHLEDAGEYSLDGSTWQRRRRRTAHLYAPGTRYWERCTARHLPFVETWFVFRAPVDGLLGDLAAPGSGFALFADDAGELARTITAHLDAARAPNMYWRAQAALLLVLDALASAKPLGNGVYGFADLPPTLADRVDRYLHDHYTDRVGLAEIARAVGVSQSTLTHRYAETTGTSPMRRLTEMRLDAARAMIVRGERLKRVAADTGFHDEYHLSKAFKRHFGQSPRHYLQGSPVAGSANPPTVRQAPAEGDRPS